MVVCYLFTALIMRESKNLLMIIITKNDSTVNLDRNNIDYMYIRTRCWMDINRYYSHDSRVLPLF